MSGVIKFLKGFACDESGATAAEYALLLAIVAAGMAIAAVSLGTAISTSMNNTSNCINAGPTGC